MPKNYFKKAFSFIASYQLSCALFLLLLVLTYLGTLSQVEQGLFQAQKKYFESFFLVHYAFGALPIPLPGGYLVLILLFINLLCGGIVRARKGWSHLGILIGHAGILVLLIGAFISYKYSISGQLTLYENEQSNLFQSFHEWEIGVAEANATGPVTEYVIPESDFAKAREGKSKTFRFGNVPFDLIVSNYLTNSAEMPARKTTGKDATATDGVYLAVLPLDKEEERNVAGVDIEVKEKDSGAVHDGILWGEARAPFTVEIGGKTWAVSLRRRQWQMPFTIELDKFTRELHPRTNMPREFSSEVTKIEGNVRQPFKITMNGPLRHRGYTLYQSSWGPPNAGPNDRLYSSLAVVKNPADKFPLYSCLIISVGLTFHFGQGLFRYLKRESAKAR